FFVLQSHYRSTLDFSEEAVTGAARGLEKLNTTLRHVRDRLARAPSQGEPTGINLETHAVKFRAAMDEDFNAPQAIAVLFDLAREVNTALQRGAGIAEEELRAIDSFFSTYAGTVLGITAAGETHAARDEGLEQGLMSLVIALRADMRKEKLWGLSDKIRDGLTQLGVTLEDGKEGTTWKRTPQA
ncbi:MAG TPA: DALR domain-containing protein, partial [Bacteroidota bacterium]|nr:DALR domain-containing protein [Bacteroidota bacterium]